MTFTDFQSESATVRKIGTDRYGDESTLDTFTVEIDPVFGFKRVFSKENEEITGRSTIITATNLQSKFDLTHTNWKLDYNGRTHNIEQVTPFYTIGTTRLEFLELVLI